MKKLFNSAGLIAAVVILLLIPLFVEPVSAGNPGKTANPGDVVWIRQFGTGADEWAVGIALDDTGVYIGGSTTGTFTGQNTAGQGHFFIRKYDTDGKDLWTRQFGGGASGFPESVCADKTGVYIALWTPDALPGFNKSGYNDAYVVKCDASGNELWTRQIATPPQDSVVATAITADAKGVYVAGYTTGSLTGQNNPGHSEDAFVRKYDASGKELWTRQFTPPNNALTWATGIYADGNWVYVTGQTHGTFPGQTPAVDVDSFIRKYKSDGTEKWTCQFSSSWDDDALAACAGPQGAYSAGFTTGVFSGQKSAGGFDAFVAKCNASGKLTWVRQFGTPSVLQNDEAWGIAADKTGVYVAGYVGGPLPKQQSAGENDAFIRKYDDKGNELWTQQYRISSDADDRAKAITTNAAWVYAAGSTGGILPGQTSAGGGDAFVIKFVK